MSLITIINLFLSVILLFLNTGAFMYFIKAKPKKEHRFMRIVFILITSAIQLTLGSVFGSLFFRALGTDEGLIRLVNETNGFLVLSMLIALEVILFLISRNRLK